MHRTHGCLTIISIDLLVAVKIVHHLQYQSGDAAHRARRRFYPDVNPQFRCADYRIADPNENAYNPLARLDKDAGCDAATFQPCSDKALANHLAVVNSFRTIYAINGNASTGAVAIGRYAEDVYQGGNPWYLAVFAAAEQLYDALAQWSSGRAIPITPISLPFFKQVFPRAKVGTYKRGSKEYATITSAVKAYADGFISVNQKYIGEHGGLAEQFSRFNGTPVSAKDLTWS